ncbi:MAG: chromate efflux transporter [Ectothiorhodospiraceae bacterium]|nr:chromate efflux transporter [Ectothiorhodospiraceae bacterium]MCH8505294.1 chromate efflux transporter [Ectothiorhodospiraceae bacterium]
MADTGQRAGSVGEVFLAFLKLGLTSFGGPIAHLGFFQTVFVQERKWLDSQAYAELVALCQFLPGPASSQVGFAIGLHRAGLGGALAAWLAFTAPSAIIMIAFGAGFAALDLADYGGIIHGLKVAAVAVVAWALWGMARGLTPDLKRLLIAVVALTLALLIPTAAGQISAIVAGALLAPWLVPQPDTPGGSGLRVPVSRFIAVLAATLFAALLVGLPLAAALTDATGVGVADSMFRAGALVFGGGHVVLPLLHAETVATGMVGADEFLAGYGLAQALPGPLFAFGGLLGTSAGGMAMGLLAIVAIFLPGCLLVLAVLPFWKQVRENPRVRRHLGGVNAAVVGILAAAFYDPVITAGILHWQDVLLALAVFAALATGRIPVWLLVPLAAVAGLLLY